MYPHIISDAIADVTTEIIILRVKVFASEYPARGQLMAELKDLMVERDRLRELIKLRDSTYDIKFDNTNPNSVKCPRCGEEMEVFSYGDECSKFWRCPWCLTFGEHLVRQEVLSTPDAEKSA